MRESLIDKKYTRLTVIAYHGSKNYRRLWLCKCSCGNETIVCTNKLKSNHTRSCGCLKSEVIHNGANTKHGLSSTALYAVLNSMRERCYNKSNNSYDNYGGRGIFICEEWMSDWTSFIEWSLQNGYKKGLELDRKDNNGNYSPENCRWVTHRNNNFNKRTNLLVNYKGEIFPLKLIVEKLGKLNSYNKIYKRIRRGISFEEAIK